MINLSTPLTVVHVKEGSIIWLCLTTSGELTISLISFRISGVILNKNNRKVSSTLTVRP